LTKELTYEPEDGETLSAHLEEFVTRGRRAQGAADEILARFQADVDPTPTPDEALAHDPMTCHHPVCRETRRILTARANRVRKD
jgi:hypothetical protein